MSLSRSFKPSGRRIAWFSILLGIGFLADAVWSLFFPINPYHFAAGFIVGAIGVERMLHGFGYYWAGRTWPWRIRAVRLTDAGLEFDEQDAYRDVERTTTLPAGLLLQADARPGAERGLDARFVVLVYSILGTVVWSEHDTRAEAEAVASELDARIKQRDDRALEPPKPTGELDIIVDSHGVMWGRAPVIPVVIAARCVALLVAIVAVPGMIPFPELKVALWGLVAVTVALLSFPFLSATAAALRKGSLLGYGMTARFGELRSYEGSQPFLTTRLSRVHHVGFGDLPLSGKPLALRLVAHTTEDADVEAYVSRSMWAEMSYQAFKLLADQYDPAAASGGKRWSVRLPGGMAEAIEAVSWAQRFVAEGKGRPLVD